MANAEIVVVGQGELQLISDLYNCMFRPGKNVETLKRRLIGRYNALLLIANLDHQPVGFAMGFELKPSTYFSWITGVMPEARRNGIASQLHEAQSAWAREHGYKYIRMECHNAHRAILHLGIKTGFDIVGVRWDPDDADNLIIFEKTLQE